MLSRHVRTQRSQLTELKQGIQIYPRHDHDDDDGSQNDPPENRQTHREHPFSAVKIDAICRACMQFHTLFSPCTQAIRQTRFASIINTAYRYLNGETNRRWRRDTPCRDAKRWPRNNNIATARGGVKSTPRYQLIEEGIPA